MLPTRTTATASTSVPTGPTANPTASPTRQVVATTSTAATAPTPTPTDTVVPPPASGWSTKKKALVIGGVAGGAVAGIFILRALLR